MGHNGWDIGCPIDTVVLAPHNGVIKEVADEGTKGYGKYIKIENDKEGSVLAHLKEFKVSIGQTVKEGETIAYSDNTGNSTASHLHWGYYRLPRNRNNGFAGFIDQADWLNAIITQPIVQGTLSDGMYFTDQTKIPTNLLSSQYYIFTDKEIEIQQLRGILSDTGNWKKDLENTRKELDIITRAVQELYEEVIK